MAAINEAVNVEGDGAASDGVDMDETVIKNTEIGKRLSRLAAENSYKGNQNQNLFWMH
ncbi:hypothetical protein SynMITS9220_03057 [Synechococcus sp. MIT S9220]|uniref:hypothetical protein n=1 Tax=unclassified Synechococcus TaxID=2626047 RepID=UPI00164A36B7|nr:hypothetical protein [Synechococcus sp. MIT S9220]NOL48246.1 hypothetical protein [Synechococcus sp. MIT S9220]QNJ24325.1 hypothetical protein SynMITS9220_03057 [Synechococcus sp. MIT S9220]